MDFSDDHLNSQMDYKKRHHQSTETKKTSNFWTNNIIELIHNNSGTIRIVSHKKSIPNKHINEPGNKFNRYYRNINGRSMIEVYEKYR